MFQKKTYFENLMVARCFGLLLMLTQHSKIFSFTQISMSLFLTFFPQKLLKGCNLINTYGKKLIYGLEDPEPLS